VATPRRSQLDALLRALPADTLASALRQVAIAASNVAARQAAPS
jgi:hypothetical protein